MNDLLNELRATRRFIMPGGMWPAEYAYYSMDLAKLPELCQRAADEIERLQGLLPPPPV